MKHTKKSHIETTEFYKIATIALNSASQLSFFCIYTYFLHERWDALLQAEATRTFLWGNLRASHVRFVAEADDDYHSGR